MSQFDSEQFALVFALTLNSEEGASPYPSPSVVCCPPIQRYGASRDPLLQMCSTWSKWVVSAQLPDVTCYNHSGHSVTRCEFYCRPQLTRCFWETIVHVNDGCIASVVSVSAASRPERPDARHRSDGRSVYCVGGCRGRCRCLRLVRVSKMAFILFRQRRRGQCLIFYDGSDE